MPPARLELDSFDGFLDVFHHPSGPPMEKPRGKDLARGVIFPGKPASERIDRRKALG
jgi:hypothetical protein